MQQQPQQQHDQLLGRLHPTASSTSMFNAAAAAVGDSWPRGKANYSMQKLLGTGATSKVYRATCPARNNAEIAIKVVNLDSSSVSMDELHRETQGMKKLRHENIVAYYGSFIEDKFLFILMDLCERSLLDVINKVKVARSIAHGVFEEHTIATIVREVLKGLQYIHENGLVHRDIKCGNILLKNDGSVQIADFGVTAFINTNPLTGLSVNPVSRHTFVGTPCWMAPEVMEQRQYGYTTKADIWSLGITALELVIILTLNNDPPNLASVEEKPGQYSAYGHKFRKFVSACLVRNDSERPSAKQMLQHPFIKAKAKDKEYIVRAVLSGDSHHLHHHLSQLSGKRRSQQQNDGSSVDSATPVAIGQRDVEDNDDEEDEEEDEWQFPRAPPPLLLRRPPVSESAAEVDQDNPDSRLPWLRAALSGRPDCRGVYLKFRLRKRKDDAPSPAGAAALLSGPDSLAAGAGGGSISVAGLAELQDISFDFAVGKDRANGITMELVESGLVSMHDMVVISRALQTLIDAPWARERVFPLNTPLPSGVFADEAEFVGYAGLSVVSVTAVYEDAARSRCGLRKRLERPPVLVTCAVTTY
uniref:non-specific serine/threonine protein kinase n=1 Tax=Macrostomum lignano TaxID=282301 RepID=A0A1I8J6H6_9PLAT